MAGTKGSPPSSNDIVSSSLAIIQFFQLWHKVRVRINRSMQATVPLVKPFFRNSARSVGRGKDLYELAAFPDYGENSICSRRVAISINQTLIKLHYVLFLSQ